MDLKKIIKGKFYYLISFLMPIVIMFIVYLLLGLWPIGKKSLIMDWDIREQYSNYFAYLKTIFAGENNLIYSFSKVLGGDVISLIGYYLASPINILFFILKDVKLDIVILIITLLKLGLCGVTFNIFITKKNGLYLYNLLFSTSYALMAYNIVYQQNLMWLDGVILLPIVLIGIDNVIQNNSFLLYVISLFASIMSNYYIGYMIGIISIIYFLYSISFEPKIKLKRIVTFFGYTMLSVGMTLFFLLPVFDSLKGGKGPAEQKGFLLDFSFSFSPINMLSKLYTGAFCWHEVMDGMPLIFCGWFITVSFILYFLNKNFSIKERIKSFILILFLVLSTQVVSLIAIWHGFNMPTGFPARNSFILSFFIIYLGYKGFCQIKTGLKLRHFIICFLILTSIFIVTNLTEYDYITDQNKIWSIFAGFVCLIMLFLIKKLENKVVIKNIPAIILLVLCLADLGLNGQISLSKCRYIDIDDLENFQKEQSPICDYIKQNDQSGFYRIEKDYMRTRNDNMLLNINGVSHYSSCEKHFVKAFLGRLGLDQYGDVYATYGKGSTMFVDSLLGIKYIMSYKRPNDCYSEFKNFNNITVYKNETAFPVEMIVDSSIKKADICEDNRFEKQNKIATAITGRNTELLKRYEDLDSSYENLYVTLKKGVKYYRKENDSLPAVLKYKIIAQDENPIYVDFITPKTSSARIKINGEYVDFNFSNINKPILKVGQFKKDEEVEVDIELLGKRLCIESALFYKEDFDMLNKICKGVSGQGNVLKKISSSHLSGKVNASRRQSSLLFSIPYEESWVVKVDGKKVDTYRALDALLLIDIDKGEHSIDLQYIPIKFYKGLLASIVSLSIIIFLYVRKKGLGHKVLKNLHYKIHKR